MSIEEIEQDAQSDPEPQSEGGDGDESYNSEDLGDSAFVVTEKRKPISKTTVGMFTVIILAMGGMYFMHQRSGPAKADAADVKSTQVIKQFMSEKEKNFSLMQKMIQETESVVKQFTTYPSVKQVPLAELSSNPFRATPAKPDEKSEERDRIKREKEAALAAVAEKEKFQKVVESLRLQSIVTSGARKACMINNTLYMVGQTMEVDGMSLTVEKIAPNRVDVKSGSHSAQLSMKK